MSKSLINKEVYRRFALLGTAANAAGASFKRANELLGDKVTRANWSLEDGDLLTVSGARRIKNGSYVISCTDGLNKMTITKYRPWMGGLVYYAVLAVMVWAAMTWG